VLRGRVSDPFRNIRGNKDVLLLRKIHSPKPIFFSLFFIRSLPFSQFIPMFAFFSGPYCD
jgi:hypothetical protein